MRRRDLLLAAAALGVPVPVLGRSRAAGDARHLVVVFAEGGWDVTFCFDPKLSCTTPGGGPCPVEGPEVDEDPDDPEDREAVRTFSGIPIVVNDRKRPSVARFFERWSGSAHVVNGIWSGSIAHVPCRYRMLTATQDGRAPDMATIAGYAHGAGLPLGSVDLSGWSIAGPLAASSGRLGASSQLAGLLDPSALGAPVNAPSDYPFFEPHPDDDALLEAWVRRRADGLRGRFGDGAANDRALDDLIASLDRGDAFRERAEPVLGALAVGRTSSLAEQADIAVELLSRGVCHAVTLDTRERWDTHDANVGQHGMFQRTFAGLDRLMSGLSDAGLLDRTVVAVVSEMTRTPLRNAATGKDHWGHGSALLLGAVRGGAVSGSTDQQVESLPMDLATGEPSADGRLCRYDAFCAGLLELVGVDPGSWLPGVVPFRGAHPA
ncbi:MAG: DUF1501 domain-containing protein [Alphaproteobacteria bacterium]|nr:DUF1501 domain-containing protein [Alphaproteobacteria bacterium]MCB9699555.1 DUF1501 domain-containing protein [Alphaproteobacteria bacterium]